MARPMLTIRMDILMRTLIHTTIGGTATHTIPFLLFGRIAVITDAIIVGVMGTATPDLGTGTVIGTATIPIPIRMGPL